MKAYFNSQAHIDERKNLPILSELIERYQDQKPFRNLSIAFGHLLVRNSLVTAEALVAGGANLLLAEAFQSPSTEILKAELQDANIPIFSVQDAAKAADIFLDVNAVLGRERAPKIAAEVTRTGIHHYQSISSIVISADACRSKRIEGFFGTGDGFLRAWQQLRPEEDIAGKHMLKFGFGKIGRGLAHLARNASVDLVLAEADAQALNRAQAEAFNVINVQDRKTLQTELAKADIILSVTGIPGMVSKHIPKDWIIANQPVLVSMGAEDEFGPQYDEHEIQGGKSVPLNFHLVEPTLNRYIDSSLSAHVMALEAWTLNPSSYSVGIHPLPIDMDQWIIDRWRHYWPNEDLSEIAEELSL